MAYIHSVTESSAAPSASFSPTLGAHETGDLLLVFVVNDGGATAISTATSGWAFLGTPGSQNGLRSGWLWKVAASGAEASPSISGANDDWLGCCFVIKDAHETAPFGASPASGTNYVAGTFTGVFSTASGNLTSPEDDCLLLYSWAQDGIRNIRCDITKAVAQSKVSSSTRGISYAIAHYQQDTTRLDNGRVTAYLNSNAAGGGHYIVSIRNRTSGAKMPDIRVTGSELYYYGDWAGTGERNDPTWQALSSFAATINGISTSAVAPTISNAGLSGLWGTTTSITNSDNSASIFAGGTHTITSADMSGTKVVTIDWINTSGSANTAIGSEGILWGFSDGTNWAVYQIRSENKGWNAGETMTACVNLDTATPYASSGTLNTAAVTRVAYFTHRDESVATARTLNIANLTILENVALVGGGANRPATWADYANHMGSWGVYEWARLQASKQVLGKCSTQVGDGTTPTYFDASASSFEYPKTYSITRTQNWQTEWNVGTNGVVLGVYAKAGDTIDFKAAVAATDTPQALTIHASSDTTTATYSFQGTSFVGWNPTWKTGVACTGITFSDCGEVAFKGANVTNCTLNNPASTDAVCSFDANGATMTDTSIDVTRTGTDSAYHIELGTAVTSITLNGVTFVGTPTSTGNDEIHALRTTDTVTITVDGTGTALVDSDVTTEGATISVVAPTLERGQNFTGLVAGSFVRVVTSDNVTQKFEDLNSSTTETWDDATSGTISVDYSVMKAGQVPIRVAGVSLTGIASTGVIDTPIDQVEDRGYAASSGLTINTNAFATVGTKKLGLTVDSTTRNFYSYLIEQWIALGNTGEAYANTDFPMESTGPTSFTAKDGWTFDLTTYPNSITNLSRGGLRYLNASGNVTDVWAAILTSGVPASLTVRYKHQSTGAWSSASAADDMDELIKIIEDPNGDGSYVDGFDRSGTMIVRVQGEGYDMAEVDVVGTFGTLNNYLYAIAPVPTVNGVATGNPTLNGSPAITVGTYVESGKTFSIKIVDGVGENSGTDLMRWIRYAQGQGGNFQSRQANDWHDLIQVNGTEYKTVRGTIYGPTATAGVIVYKNDGVTLHPDFNLFTADDGTTLTPAVTADVDITGMPTAVAANTRLQIINQTALTAAQRANSTAYSVGDMRLRQTGIGTENVAGLYLRCTTAGTSAGAPPVWNTTPGGTTTDGTVTWTTYKVLFYDADPVTASYSTQYIDGEEFVAGETAEIRFAEMDAGTSFKTYSTTTIAATTGFSVSVAEEADTVYASNGLDGSSYEATFSPDYNNDYLVMDTNTDFSGKSAYAYFCYLLTTSQGMYEFWGGMFALDTGNYRIETDILSLYFDCSTGFVKQTDDVRIFRSDGLRPALDPVTAVGGGIEINWRTPVSVVSTGGSALTPTESAQLMSLPSAADIWSTTLPL